MSEPWMDEIEEKRRAYPRAGGCGCSTRARLIALALVLVMIAACFLGNKLVDRYHQRQQIKQQIEQRNRIPPPPTPAIVPPAGGALPRPTATRGGG